VRNNQKNILPAFYCKSVKKIRKTFLDFFKFFAQGGITTIFLVKRNTEKNFLPGFFAFWTIQGTRPSPSPTPLPIGVGGGGMRNTQKILKIES
jgi:hypothetical protein